MDFLSLSIAENSPADSSERFVPVYQLLLDSGCDFAPPNPEIDWSQGYLARAIVCDNLSLMEFAVTRARVDINAALGHSVIGPIFALHTSVRNGAESATRLLLRLGADPALNSGDALPNVVITGEAIVNSGLLEPDVCARVEACIAIVREAEARGRRRAATAPAT